MSDDTLRGEGLMRAQRALTALAEDQQRLEDELTRFDNSPPPPYSAPQSHNSTRSQSSDLPSDEQRRREERKWQQILEREASLPYNQFLAQRSEEREWVVEADRNGTHPLPIGVDWYKLAWDIVKKRWVDQGIWNEKWTPTASGIWKHQEPLELESELEADDEKEPQSRIFPGVSNGLPSKPTQSKSDEEKRRIAEQRSREREASRPFHQFVYQLSIHRERIQDLLGNEGAASTTADINTRAYERVRSFWVEQKIWDERWGIMPGMSWKHEEPLQEPFEQETTLGLAPAQTNLLGNFNNRTIREEPPSHLFETSNHHASSTLDMSQQARPTNTESAGLANSDTEHSSPKSDPYRSRYGKRISHPATRRTAQPKTTHEDEIIQAIGLAHASKVSKVPGKKKSGRRQQRLDTSAVEIFDGPSVPAGPDVTEVTSLTTTTTHPRRSDRLGHFKPIVAEDSQLINSAEPRRDGLRIRPKREATSNPTSKRVGKPQGISKKRRPQQRARK